MALVKKNEKYSLFNMLTGDNKSLTERYYIACLFSEGNEECTALALWDNKHERISKIFELTLNGEQCTLDSYTIYPDQSEIYIYTHQKVDFCMVKINTKRVSLQRNI